MPKFAVRLTAALALAGAAVLAACGDEGRVVAPAAPRMSYTYSMTLNTFRPNPVYTGNSWTEEVTVRNTSSAIVDPCLAGLTWSTVIPGQETRIKIEPENNCKSRVRITALQTGQVNLRVTATSGDYAEGVFTIQTPPPPAPREVPTGELFATQAINSYEVDDCMRGMNAQLEVGVTASSYRWERSLNGTAWQQIGTNSAYFNGPIPVYGSSTKYYYRVRVVTTDNRTAAATTGLFPTYVEPYCAQF